MKIDPDTTVNGELLKAFIDWRDVNRCASFYQHKVRETSECYGATTGLRYYLMALYHIGQYLYPETWQEALDRNHA